MTEITVNALATRGGLIESGLPGRVHWFGTTNPPMFKGWNVIQAHQLRPVSLELLKLFEATSPGADLLFLEDDVIPCRNAIIAAANVKFPKDCGLISFYDYRNEWTRPGLFPAPPEPNGTVRRGLMGSQAVKFPAHIVPILVQALRIKAAKDEAQKKYKAWQVSWDHWMGDAVIDAGFRVYHYAPSLFQHGGAKWSVANEGSLHYYTKNFPGQDFDALGPCPDPIVSGPFDEIYQECRFHGRTHPGGVICRWWPIDHGDEPKKAA